MPKIETYIYLNKNLFLDPVVPLLEKHQEKKKILIKKDTVIPMFIAAPSTIAKTWKQPKCPSTDEWVKMYLYTMESYSAIKKNTFLPFAASGCC